MTRRATFLRRTCALAFALLLAAEALAHVRLRDPNTLVPLAWPSPGSISIVISSRASPDLSDAERFTAIRNAIDAWNDVPESALLLVEDTSPAQQAREDFTAEDLHQIRFDDGSSVFSSMFFPEFSGIVAVTPVKFKRGVIVDADILFNDGEFQFTASGEPNGIDVQDVATHELGHFVGLDHTGVGGSTMYPFVSPGEVLQRSLAADDANGAADIAPSVALGRIEGRIRRSSGASLVSGAHVTANDASGRSVSAGITGLDGSFRLVFSEAGLYSLFVNPLSGVVGAENLAVAPIHTDFGTFSGPTVALAAGQTSDVGDLFAPQDVFVQLGLRADSLPVRAVAGEVSSGPFVVGGLGLSTFSSLTTPHPGLSLVGVAMQGSSVRFFITTPLGTAPGHADLVVTTPTGAVDRIPGAIEITPLDPVVDAVVPAVGLRGGGYVVTLSGSGFLPGARVVLGENVYTAGNGCEVLDDGTIEVLTRASSSGLRDVVAIDATGVEGRLENGFRFTSVPVLDSVFPPAGDANGGTVVFLKGRDFESDVVVRIGGASQPFARIDGSTLRVTTAGASPATALVLEVENPGGGVAGANFDYVVGPDPALTSLSPTTGRAGERVSVVGRGFSPDTTVVFGANPETGAGGAAASSVLFLGATLLEVEVPALAAGAVSVMVRDSVTGQASLANAAFTVQATPGGGGGGGCHTRFVPLRPEDVLAGTAWLVVLAALHLATRRQAVRAAETALARSTPPPSTSLAQPH